MSTPKYALVAARVRAEIADGVLKPGEPVPSGAALARMTGYSVLTCRRGLSVLIKEGTLVPGASRSARPRVPGPVSTQDDQARAIAARSLSACLAGWRRAAGLTQPQLAALTGMSITTIGHAETGRLWQSRRFWERADKQLSAGANCWRGMMSTAPQPPRLIHKQARTSRRTPPTSLHRPRWLPLALWHV